MYKVFKPKSELLQKYISAITVLKKKSSFPKEYFAFPHKISAIAFLQHSKIRYNRQYLEIDRAQNKDPLVIIIGKYVEPLLVRYNNYVNEIVIYFTPVGINYFFDENCNDIAKFPIQVTNDTKLKEFSILLFNTNEKDRIFELERFFEQRFRDKNLQLVENIISTIENENFLKFQEISKKFNISERSLNRLFNKYIGCSPKDYKRIIRFRGAIKDYSPTDLNLTQLCLENDFYDSSHFTKEFKKLTNKNPRDYFKHLTFTKNNFPYIFN